MLDTNGRAVAIIPCIDLDAAERWWNRLGFRRPEDQGYAEYRMLSDEAGASIHLGPTPDGWVIADRNPFGIYLYTPRVAALAAVMRDAVIGVRTVPEHKPWGMYEVALNGPDGLLVRIGWASRLIADAGA